MTHGDPTAWSKEIADDVDQALQARGRDTESVEDALTAVRDIERQVASKTPGDAEMGALVAAARIRGWHESLGAIFAVAEAEIMECCLGIRRQHPGRDAFGAFVAEHVRVLTPTKAWRLADTWEVAKRHRTVRELVNREPRKAIAFVQEFTAAAAEEQAPLPLDADDREIAGILAAPPRKRRGLLRELVAAHRAPRDRHPDDVERIRELEAEREERSRAEAANATKATRAELLRKYREATVLLGEVASEVVATLDGEKLAEHSRRHLEMSNDIAVGGIEAVVRLTFEEDE